ncbi:MAG: hypothetical protein Q9221_003576 [Calogaya cf. arnoldii]
MYTPSALLFLATLVTPLYGLPVEEMTSKNSQLAERQFGGGGLAINCPHDRIVGEPKGTSTHYWQVNDNVHCNNGECEIGAAEGHEFGIEVSAGIDLHPGKILGGVSAGKEEETVCVWRRAEYETYDVETSSNGCNNAGPVEVKLPVSGGGATGGFEYVHGAQFCRSKDQHYWEEVK